MTLDDLRHLLDYHYWALHRVLDAVGTLTDDQYTRDLVSSFRSVRDTLVHTYAAEWAWHSRWHGHSPTTLITSDSLPTLAALRTAWDELEARMQALLAAAEESDVSRRCPARRTVRTARRPARADAPVSGREDSARSEHDGYVLESWVLDLNGLEPVPAYVARPRKCQTAGCPGGRLQPLARGRLHDRQEGVHRGPQYLQPKPYAKELTDLGYVAHRDRSLGLRRAQPHERAGHVQADALEGPGAVGDDGLRQPPRDRRARAAARRRPERLATLGMSMGSTMAAWWLAALDERA
jgi:hypothetical protein